MGSASTAVPLPLARLAGIGAVVFLANAALLVLQLVASRLLAPFIGSDLYTWTSIIGVFLTGIALGNAYGGKLADRYPSPRTLAALLLCGAAAAAWMALAPVLFHGFYRSIPLGPRIPILSAILCLPAGFVLSLLTPLAIKLGLPDVSKTGRVAGLIFSLSTFGCLLGNYATGFYLVPAFTIDSLVFVAAGSLLALAIGAFVVLKLNPPDAEVSRPPTGLGSQEFDSPESTNPHAFANIQQAFLVVFLASFSGMTLELTAARLIAHQLGVSLFSWTGVIGVMLAGTALGNLTGGFLADRANQPGGMRRSVAWITTAGGALYVFAAVYKGLKPLLLEFNRVDWLGPDEPATLLVLASIASLLVGIGTYFGTIRLSDDLINPRTVLAGTLVAAGTVTILLFVSRAVVTRSDLLAESGLVWQVLGWTFALFFLPMFALGMVSPQVIRLAVPDVAHVGRVAGRVYAWSTAGAIAGTFTAGYVLISTFGVDRCIIGIALVLMCLSLAVAEIWKNNLLLYAFSIGMGGVTGGIILTWNPMGKTSETLYLTETNYYTIRVTHGVETPRVLNLYLDRLLHSTVDLDDPSFLKYEHEHMQMEFLRAARAGTPMPKMLVIGGGGYTFPRYAKLMLPETALDVVEIDPGVTRVAYEHLGLNKELGIRDFNMDGRQFVAEVADPHSYDLVVQDAVNDFTVPGHLLTKEYNDAVNAALKPEGVYLLTIIDEIEHGKLWRASMATLKQTFTHVALLTSAELPPLGFEAATRQELDDAARERRRWAETRQVYVIYASNRPLDEKALRLQTDRAANHLAATAIFGAPMTVLWKPPPFYTHTVPDALIAPFLERDPGVILTDQYAPVDNLMAEVFRRR